MATERIMDHEFENGWCVKCRRLRVDVVCYGHPDITLSSGEKGLSCTGASNENEIQSLRDAWRRDREVWDKLFG